MFACEHFEPCPIVDLPNYRDFILTTLKNGAAFESIEILDTIYLENDDFD